jgi:hypothetical protein
MDDARLSRKVTKGCRGVGRGEIEHRLALRKDGQRIIRHVHMKRFEACECAGILAKFGRTLALYGACDLAILMFADSTDQGPAHAARSTYNGKTHQTSSVVRSFMAAL